MSGNTQQCEIFFINSDSFVSDKLQPTPRIGLSVASQGVNVYRTQIGATLVTVFFIV